MSKTRKNRMSINNKEYMRINCPVVPGSKITNEEIMRVTQSDDIELRKAIYKIAQYFKREFRYDFTQYSYREKDEGDRVSFIWLGPNSSSFIGNDDFLLSIIGATSFVYREYTDAPHSWAMQWIWIFPFFRRQGLLSKSWKDFRNEFGNFVCEPPLSIAMNTFLKVKGECWKCGSKCKCEYPKYEVTDNGN